MVTVGLTAVGAGGSALIRQKFDPVLLLPAESYLRQWKLLHDQMFPENGAVADIYTGHINHTHLEHLETMVKSLQEIADKKQFIRGVYPWWTSLKDYSESKANLSSWREMTKSEEVFSKV